MDDLRKDHIDSKRSPWRNRPKQLHSHNMPTDDVENTNGTDKGKDLCLANKPQIVPRGTEKMLQMIHRHRIATLHWLTDPQREQDETEKSSHGLDWQQKGIWYVPEKLDNDLPQNV